MPSCVQVCYTFALANPRQNKREYAHRQSIDRLVALTRLPFMQTDVTRYLSVVQYSHRTELTTGYVHHHFVLQAAANPPRCRLVGRRPRTHLARVVVTPREHLNAERNAHRHTETHADDEAEKKLARGHNRGDRLPLHQS